MKAKTETKGESNGAPPGPLDRIKALWAAEQEAQKEADQAHEVYQAAKSRLDKKRHEKDLYLRGLCESRPLYDQIPEPAIGPEDGEPIDALGLTPKELDRACLDFTKQGGLSARPVQIQGRPHVVVNRYGREKAFQWDVRPLWLETAFATKYPDAELKDRAGGTDPYCGVRVQVGKVMYAVGSQAEERSLIQENKG